MLSSPNTPAASRVTRLTRRAHGLVLTLCTWKTWRALYEEVFDVRGLDPARHMLGCHYRNRRVRSRETAGADRPCRRNPAGPPRRGALSRPGRRHRLAQLRSFEP